LTDSPPIWAIHGVAILGGAAVVIEGPSRQALVYQLVGREEPPNAIAVIGVGWCFVFNALSFMAVLPMLLLMRTSDLFPIERARTATDARAIRDGLAHVWGSPLMRTIATCAATMGLGSGGPVAGSNTVQVQV